MIKHKTFRDLEAHSIQQRKHVQKLLEEAARLTLEEAIFFQAELSRMMWLSLNQVEEKFSINQNNVENVEELV